MSAGFSGRWVKPNSQSLLIPRASAISAASCALGILGTSFFNSWLIVERSTPVARESVLFVML